MRKSIIFALMLMGFNFVIAETLLIRELLATFYGNELSIGLIFANWLILEAIGSSLSGRIANKVREGHQAFAILQLVISLSLPAAVYGTRTIKGIVGLPPGESVGFPWILACSFLLLTPISLPDGAQFTFGSKIFSELMEEGAPSIARVYIYESLGAIVGGLTFTYLLIPHFHSMQIAYGVAALNLLSASLLLIFFRKRPMRALDTKINMSLLLISVTLLISNLYILFSPKADEIHHGSIRRQWRNFDLEHYQNSIYGNVAVIQRENQFTFFADGIPIFTTPDPDITFVEELVHLPMLFHPGPRKVLLVGGGVGGVLREVLKYPVERVDYAELDPLIIEVAQRFSTPLTEYELTNPRVMIKHIDGRLFINQSREQYDLIIVNLPAPSTLQLNRFYTKEFFQRAKEILGPDGILVIHSPGSLTYLSEELTALNACLYYTLKEVFPEVRLIPGDSNLFLASASRKLSLTEVPSLIERFEELELETRLISDFHIAYKLDQRRLNWLLGSLDQARKTIINRDLLPAGVFYDISFWNALFSPQLRGLFRLIGRVNLYSLLIPLALIASSFLVGRKRISRLRRAPVAFTIITTGFAGMVFGTVFILTFQCLYGYVYHIIGLLIAAFMLGLTIGSTLMTHFLDKIRREQPLLMKLELLILFYSLLTSPTLILLHAHINRPGLLVPMQIALFTLNLICGALVGSEFPLANKIFLKLTEEISEVAGTLYASDLVGAWMGALLASIVLIPVLGIPQTCLLVAAVKLVSLVLVSFSSLP